MKTRFLPISVVLLLLSFAGFGWSETGVSTDGKIITAIDVAELLRKGVDVKEIVGHISQNTGFNRGSDLKMCETDIRCIYNVITKKYTTVNRVDLQKSSQHKTNADKFYNEALYNNAASEYTAAIFYSSNDHELYLRRGNTNKRYLMDNMSSMFKDYSLKENGSANDNAINFMCNAIIDDYSIAAKLNDEAITSANQELYLLKYNMKIDRQYPRYDQSVKPYYAKAAQNTADMMQLRRMYQGQRMLMQVKSSINEAIAKSKMLCEGNVVFKGKVSVK